MKEYTTDKIRNIALAGHGGSGKTTLAEAMLFRAGATDRFGKIADGNTVCDFDPEEIKRNSSVASAVAPLEWDGLKFNIIDTPGAFDFEAGVIEGISACDTVIIEISGKSGVTVGAQKAYKLAKKLNKAVMFFVSKLDRESANFYKVFYSLRDLYGTDVCSLVIPHGKEGHVESYIHVSKGKAFTFDDKGVMKEVPLPEDEHLEQMQNALTEAVAEADEELLDKYLSGEPFTDEEYIKGVKIGVKRGSIVPVFAGSALFLEGIELFLNAIRKYTPAPSEVDYVAYDKEGLEVNVKCDVNEPALLNVFKTVADPFVGKLSFFKVLSGKIESDMTLVNSTTGENEKIGKLLTVRGKKQEDAKAVLAGDIGAVAKLSNTATGDCLCASSRVLATTKMLFPTPTLSMAVTPKAKGDEGKIASSIQRLQEEDQTIKFETNAETRQQVISGLGEQHLDVVVSKLKNKFGIDVDLEPAKVPYRGTIKKKVKVQGKYKKQSGGHGQYGDVWIEFEPCDSEELVFEEKVFGGAVPKNFFPAVEKGLRDSMEKGFKAGYKMVGVKATLFDGSYHPVDSSEMSFKLAANLAFKNGMAEASPILLEPIGKLVANIPETSTGDVMGDLNKRRGRVLGITPVSSSMSEIEAEVPMSEISDFTTVLRSMTQGRGSFEVSFERYEPMPSNLEEKIVAEYKATKTEE